MFLRFVHVVLCISSSFFLFYFIFLILAVLGLRFCARAFSSCGKRGPLLIAVRGPFTIAASLVAEHRLQMRRLSSCGSRAQSLRGMWYLPRPGFEPVSPALAGRFSTTAPPGKPSSSFFNGWVLFHFMYMLQFVYLLSCWWTFGSFPVWACITSYRVLNVTEKRLLRPLLLVF